MVRRSPLLISALCSLAACSETPTPAQQQEERVGTKTSALEAEPKPPEREIAIVIDGSGNVDPYCDWDPDSWTYTDDGYGTPIPLAPTRVLCDQFDGFEQQKQGLISAIRTHVPLGGKMALSVVLSASRQDEYTYLGPPVVVPYTLIRTQADKNNVIGLVRNMQVQTARGIPGPDSWLPGTTHRCQHNYDPSSGMVCPSTPSHAWAVNTAFATLQDGPPASTDPDAGPHMRAASREICIAADLAHSVPPTAYWRNHVSTTGSLPPTYWPDGIPEEAKSWAPFESALSVDRFTAIHLTRGITAPGDLLEMSRGKEPPFWYDWDWGAIITLEGEVTADDSQLVIALNEIHEDEALPVPVQPPLAPIAIPVTKGMTAQQVASQLNDVLWASQGFGYGDLPVISALAENEVLFAANMRHEFQSHHQLGLGSVSYYPHIAVVQAPEGMTATLQGGSQTPIERVVEYEQLSVQEAYGRLISGCAEVIFPSGRMQTHPYPNVQQRTFDYASALGECFDDNSEPAAGAEGVSTLEGEPEPGPPGGGGSGGGSAGSGGASSGTGQNYCLDKPRLVAIEVNQVIQDWNNSVPLIREKPTTARVFIESMHSGTVERVTLYGYKYVRGGSPCAPSAGDDSCVAVALSPASQPGTAAVQIPTNASVERGNLRKSAQVTLPESWTRETQLFLKAATRGARLTCREPSDLTPANDCMVGVLMQAPQLLTAAGDAPPLIIRQRPLKWDDRDVNDNLKVRPEDMVESFNAAVLHLPAKVTKVTAGTALDLTSWTQARRAATPPKFVPDSAWWQARINARCVGPACLDGTGRDETGWLTPAEISDIGAFTGDLTVSLARVRLAECTRSNCPASAHGIWAGQYHLPPMRRGRAWGVFGAMAEDVGGMFEAGYVGGAHETMHTLGRKHTDYCFSTADAQYRPMCDEPYAYEIRSSSAPFTTVPGMVTYPGGAHPPLPYLPALGPIGTGLTRSEVWGFESNQRRQRAVEVVFPRGMADPTFELTPRALDPRFNSDIMSYCDNGWVSRFQYDRLFRPTIGPDGQRVGGHISAFTENPARSKQWFRPQPLEAWCANGEHNPLVTTDCEDATGRPCGFREAFVTGTIDTDTMQVQLDPVTAIDPVVLDPEETDGAVVHVSLRDALGNELYHVTTPAETLEAQQGAGPTRDAFFARIPRDPSVVQLAVSDGTVDLALLTASEHAPTVVIDSPVAGEHLAGSQYTFGWTGNDADGDPLFYDVAYSAAVSQGWLPLTTLSNDDSLTFDTGSLAGSEQAYLRVRVSDGFHTATTITGPFSVARKAPRPHVLSLTPGQVFYGSDQVPLRSMVIDAEAAFTTTPVMTTAWSSDRDGVLGTGDTSVAATQLSEGTHVITLTATDGDGQTGTTQVSIEIHRFDTSSYAGPKLLLEKSHEGDFEVGTIGSYELVVQNVGTAPTTSSITITDTLPEKLEFISATGTDWTCDEAQHVVTCTYSGPALGVGEVTPTITLEVEPQLAGAALGSSYGVTNRATAVLEGAAAEANSETEDPALVFVSTAPVLGTQSGGGGVVRLGQPVHYTLMVTNGGTTHAHEVAVDMSVALGAEITGASGSQWTCTVAETTAHCTYAVDAVAPGEVLPTIDVTVVVRDLHLASIDLRYSVSARSGTQLVLDGGIGGDGGIDAGPPTTVVGETPEAVVQPVRPSGPDLSVHAWGPCEGIPSWVFALCSPAAYDPRKGRIVGREDALRQGGIWRHRIEVWNAGNETASNPVTVVDVLPEGVEPFVSDEPEWNCTLDGRQFSCDYMGPPLEPNDFLVLDVDYFIADDAPKQLDFTTSVSTDDDVDAINDSFDHGVTLIDKPCKQMSADGTQCMDDLWSLPATGLDVAIGLPDTLVVGATGQATFTVTNRGTSAVLKNNVVLDALGDPSLLVVSGYSGAGWVCGLNWGKAACTYLDPLNGSLAAGDSLPPLVVSYTVGPFVQPQMLVPAQVGTTTTTASRVFVKRDVEASAPLVGPTQGTLAYTACPPGTDCIVYKQQFPTKFPQGRREVRLLDLATLESTRIANSSDYPAWTNDGAMLSLNSVSGNCSPNPDDDDCNSSVYAYYLDGQYMVSFSMAGGKSHSLIINTFNSRFGSWTIGQGLVYSRPISCSTCTSDYPHVRFGNRVRWDLRFAQNQTRNEFGGLFHLTEGQAITDTSTQNVFPAVAPITAGLAFTSDSPPKIMITDNSAGMTNKRRLTTAAASVREEQPAWSRDAARIAFSSNGSIHIANRNGTNEIAITTGTDDTHPTWSPDNTKLAFERGGSDPGIFVVDATGGTPVLIARGRHPAWRPTAIAAATPPGVPPLAALDHLVTPLALPISGNVLANDTDPGGTALTLVSSTQGRRGDVSCTAAGVCTYSPKSGFVGEDEFTYVVRNVAGVQATGTVSVEVTGVSAQVVIESPANLSGLPGNTTTVTGLALLDYVDPKINAIFMVDTNSAGAGSHGDVVINSSHYSPGANPNTWNAPPAGVDSLCAQYGPGDLADCYLSMLSRSLATVPNVQTGALMFADDYQSVKTATTYWTMPSPLHNPPEYRSNVYKIDVDPAFQQQLWTTPTADKDGDGIFDIERAIRSVHRFQAGQRSCYWGYSGSGGIEQIIPIGGDYFAPVTGDPLPLGNGTSSFYATPVACRFSAGGGIGGSETQQTYDFVLRTLNERFATRPLSEHNVAYLISGGRQMVDDSAGSPLAQAVRAGTVIHTFAPAARPTDPVDVVWLVDARTSSAAERSHIAARMAEHAADLAASTLDYQVLLISDTNWFAGTAVAARTTFSSTSGDPVPRLSSGDFLGWGRPAATEHVIGVNITATPTNELPRAYFGHAVSRLGPEWCPGSTANTVAFDWARARRGVKVLTCDGDWGELMRAIELPSYPAVTGGTQSSYYALKGERPAGSCQPGNALARIARATGGTCTEVSWETDEVVARLPPLPELLPRDVSSAGTQGIDRLVVARAAGGTPVTVIPDTLGRWSANLTGLTAGANVLNATLYLRDGHTTTSSITVYVQPGYNTPPTLQNFPIRVTAGIPRQLDILDFSFDSDPFTVTSYDQPEQGSVTCAPDGLCTYLAPAGSVGQDVFWYTVTDARGGQSSNYVTLILNNPPIAPDQVARITGSTPTSIGTGVSDPDFDALSVTAVSAPQHGQVSCQAYACTYQADDNFTGIDSFSYTVSDGRGGTATGTITVMTTRGGPNAAVALGHTADFIVGQEGTYDVIVGNRGDQPLAGARLLLELPGMVFTGFSGEGWTCTSDPELACSSTELVESGATFEVLHLRAVPLAEAMPETIASARVVLPLDIDPNDDLSTDPTVVRDPQVDAAVTVSSAQLCEDSAHVTVQVKNEGGLGFSSVHVELFLPIWVVSVAEVAAEGWTCVPTPDGLACDYGVPLPDFGEPPPIVLELERTYEYESYEYVGAVVTAPGDENPDNDEGYGDFVLGNGTDDYDGDGLVQCADTCPYDYNPGDVDEDGDGFGELCDTCPTVPNPDQWDSWRCLPDIDIRSILSDGTTLNADISIANPSGGPVQGELTIESFARQPLTTGVRITTASRCNSGTLYVKAGNPGQIVAAAHFPKTGCSCEDADSLRVIDVVDPVLIAMFDSPYWDPETTPIYFEKASGLFSIVYVKAEITYDDGQTQTVCVYDASTGGTCNHANICDGAHNSGAIFAYQEAQPREEIPGGVVRYASYVGDPSLAWDISNLPSGTYQLRATATDGIAEPDWDLEYFEHVQETAFSVNPTVQLNTRLTLLDDASVCEPVELTVEVMNSGSKATSAPITATASCAGGIRVESANGPGWSCSVEAGSEVSCTYVAQAEPGEILPLIALHGIATGAAGTDFECEVHSRTLGVEGYADFGAFVIGGDPEQAPECADLCVTSCGALDQCHLAGTCDPNTGLCSNPSSPNGTPCNDGDATTTGDVCTGGVCAGVGLCAGVTCAPLDQCHVAGTCNPATGVCSNPNRPDGTVCDDGNANTASDVCIGGTCAGGDLCAGVTCTALDQCHLTGACNPATGACSNPNRPDGTVCNDGNASTVNDACTSGTCAGVNLCANVTCTALDQCHAAGACHPATGACSNPNRADGTTCDDGLANTVGDVCTTGSCAGVDLCANVTCAALDQCHVVGTCDQATGMCSNPSRPNGTVCNDANANTVNDVCTAGTCVGVDLCANVICAALDQCHVAGTCDHATGACSNPNRPNGTVCDDAHANTINDVCTNGTCEGVDLCANVTCTAQDQCHVAGSCNPLDGVCSNPNRPNGTVCNDGLANTVNDMCTAGTCAGVDLCANVTCTAQNQCHAVGTCDPQTGVCSNPNRPNGTACTDGNACTTTDTCQTGACTAGPAASCNDANACTADSCNPSSGCAYTPQNLPPAFTTFPPSPVLRNDCGPANIGSAVAADPCGQSVTVSNSACGSIAGMCGEFGRGNTTVTWTAADGTGLTAQTQSTVTVTDATPPTNLFAPPAITLTTVGSVTLAMLDPSNLRSAFDNCGARTGQPITWRTVPSLPGPLPVGTSTVQWFARDDLGNENPFPVSQQVTIVEAGGGSQVAWAGHEFSCALTSSGKVQCWGANGSGELGDGTTSERWAPGYVSLTSATQLGVGFSHACVVTANGGAQCWGEGGSGRLGNNSTSDRTTPVSVSSLTGVRQVSAGGTLLNGHSCAVKTNGEVWCWGTGSDGRLGNNSVLDRSTPVKAQFPAGTVLNQVSAGGNHSCAVDSIGKAWCWGEGVNGQLGNGSILDRQTPVQVSFGAGVVVAAVSSGGEHTCAVLSNGEAWCWGEGIDGQLGNDSFLNRNTPQRVQGLPGPALQVSSGNDHSCVVLTNGQVWCWGEGLNGELGNGSQLNRSTPVRVTGLTGALQVSAGDDHSCARVQDGAVKRHVCWGKGGRGQLGNGRSNDVDTLVSVARLCAPSVVAAGDAFSCAVGSTSAGSAVHAWGENSSSQLGDGTSSSRIASLPASNSVNASAVDCASSHACTVVAGQARCWGNNGSGRLGDGTSTNRSTPTAVSGGDTYTMVTTGSAHSCGLVSGGGVKCWGSGANGRLGTGNTSNRLSPTSVTGLPGAAQWITAGDAHTCAVVVNGSNREVWCWGTGASGRLGNNATSDSSVPVRATGITAAATASAGLAHTCATTTTGFVYCWGYGLNGRLGNGSTSNSNVPVQVQISAGTPLSLTASAVVAAGGDFSCVTGASASGQLACWGNNSSGQLGDGTTTSSTRAKLISSSAGASTVTAGTAHACAVLASQPFCWGSNSNGRLGDGTTQNRTAPRAVASEECN